MIQSLLSCCFDTRTKTFTSYNNTLILYMTCDMDGIYKHTYYIIHVYYGLWSNHMQIFNNVSLCVFFLRFAMIEKRVYLRFSLMLCCRIVCTLNFELLENFFFSSVFTTSFLLVFFYFYDYFYFYNNLLMECAVEFKYYFCFL